MTAEQFLWAWLRSEILEPKELLYESQNTYYEVMKEVIGKKEKEGRSKHDEIN
jgi:hypothetical protein